MTKQKVGSAKINGLLVHVDEEDTTSDVKIPSHKVEKGINLSDHVEREPIVVQLSGLLVRATKKEVESLIKNLLNIEKKGTLVTYQGRRIYTNMLLKSLNFKADSSIRNGFTFTCTLTEVRIAKPAYVPPKRKAVTSPTSKAGRKQTTNKKTSPIYHKVKKGDTYYALGKKYNVKWQQLQKWNGYPPKKIPIGVKLRVG